MIEYDLTDRAYSSPSRLSIGEKIKTHQKHHFVHLKLNTIEDNKNESSLPFITLDKSGNLGRKNRKIL